MALTRWVGRAIGLDVHRDFCVVAICEDGQVRSGARVPSTPEGLALLAREPGGVGSGGVGGDGQLLGGGADPRAARRPGGRGQPGRHRDHAGAREDRPAGRAHVGEAVVVGRAGVGVDARRALPRAASPAGAARAARALALAREERDPRRAAAPPAGQAAVLGPVRRQGPPVAGRPRAAAGGARVRRRRDPPHRVPRRRDRRGRAADRPTGARVAGDPAADDRPGREPDLRRDASSPPSATRAGS